MGTDLPPPTDELDGQASRRVCVQAPEGKLPLGAVRAGALGPLTGPTHRTTTGPRRLSSERNGGQAF